VEIIQESLDLVKQFNQDMTILKLDLSKAYDRVISTIFLLVVLEMGLDLFVVH